MQPGRELTELLQAWTGGERDALDALMPSVYDELKRIAAAYVAREPHARTLQATGLVNEAYLRLVQVRPTAWASRGQFYAFTAQIMRRILVDHARAQLAAQRGGGAPHIPIDDAQPSSHSAIGIDDALAGLERIDQRKSKIVELRIFGGFSIDEIAEALAVSPRTVLRDWQLAKAWLARELHYNAVRDD